jgi:hypothetical protein
MITTPLKSTVNKLLPVFIIAFLVASIGWIIYFRESSTITYTIESAPDAKISVAAERGGDFEQIGVGKATLRARDEQGVFVRAENSSGTSLTYVNTQAVEAGTITMPIRERVEPEVIASDGSVSYPLIKNRVLYGVDSETFNLRALGPNTAEIKSPELPLTRKIIWQDEQNFMFSSYRDGVGAVINNMKVLNDGLARTVALAPGVEPSPSEIFINDIAKTKNSPFVLLGDDGIYVSDNIGLDTEKILHTGWISTEQLHLDDTYIYLNAETQVGSYASDVSYDDITIDPNQPPVTTTTMVYNYQGALLGVIETFGNKVIGVVSGDNHSVVASDHGILTFNPMDINPESVGDMTYFEATRDIVSFNNTTYVLADQSVWSYDEASRMFQEVANVSEYGNVLEKSFVADPEESALYFGVTRTLDNEQSQNAMLRIVMGI